MKETIITVVIPIVLFLAIVGCIVIPNTVNKTEECGLAGGVMVKTSDGVVCAKLQVIK